MELLLHQVMTGEPEWHPLSAGKLHILSAADPMGNICVTPHAFSGTLPRYVVTLLLLLKQMLSCSSFCGGILPPESVPTSLC